MQHIKVIMSSLILATYFTTMQLELSVDRIGLANATGDEIQSKWGTQYALFSGQRLDM